MMAARTAGQDSGEAVLREVRDRIGVVTFNRPEKFNCISSALVDGLDEAITAFEDDPAVRVVLIRANGKHFCTGADLTEVNEARRTRRTLATFIGRFHRVLRRLETSPHPVVCAINGLALAGGLEVVLACDVALAAADARIGDQHAQYGLIPGGGGTQRLPRVVGPRRALELMYSARWLDAQEALGWGLVNELVPPAELGERALALCRDLADKNPEGLAAMKSLARRGLEMSLGDGLALEEQHVVEGLRTENVAEGLAAFAERRKPVFK